MGPDKSLLIPCAKQQANYDSSLFPQNLATKMDGNLLDIVPGWLDLAVSDEPEDADPRMVMEPYLSVWMGGASVVTQAHYDVANNVFCQLHGRKRFRCWGSVAYTIILRCDPTHNPKLCTSGHYPLKTSI